MDNGRFPAYANFFENVHHKTKKWKGELTFFLCKFPAINLSLTNFPSSNLRNSNQKKTCSSLSFIYICYPYGKYVGDSEVEGEPRADEGYDGDVNKVGAVGQLSQRTKSLPWQKCVDPT